MRVLPPSHYYTSLVIRSHFGPAERNKVEKERPFHLLYWIALLTGSCYIQVQPFSSSQIAKRTNWTGQLLHWTGRAANAKTFSSALKYTARRCTAWAPEKSIKIIIPSPDVCNTTCYVLWAVHKLHLHFLWKIGQNLRKEWRIGLKKWRHIGEGGVKNIEITADVLFGWPPRLCRAFKWYCSDCVHYRPSFKSVNSASWLTQLTDLIVR